MEEKGLKNTAIGLMVGTAIFFDVSQWALAFILMDWLVGFFAFLTFYLWFKIKGLNFATPKRAGIMGGGFIIEIIPLLSSLPAWTLAVTLLALDSKVKKLTGNFPEGNTVMKTRNAPYQKPSYNQTETPQRAAGGRVVGTIKPNNINQNSDKKNQGRAA